VPKIGAHNRGKRGNLYLIASLTKSACLGPDPLGSRVRRAPGARCVGATRGCYERRRFTVASAAASPLLDEGPVLVQGHHRVLGITNTLIGTIRKLEQAPDAAATAGAWRTFLVGLAEGTVPLIVTFALLAVAWLLAAVGLRRQA
jgi:hypothetical protein